jgi:methyl-accepting chemotaxis protein
VEEAAAAAASMQEQAGRLAQEVRRFKVEAGGSARDAQVRLAQAVPAAARKPAAAPARRALQAAGEDWSAF